jgi:hypothetical protein
MTDRAKFHRQLANTQKSESECSRPAGEAQHGEREVPGVKVVGVKYWTRKLFELTFFENNSAIL